MRDAIVISPYWDWDAFNVPERNAIALASLGARVLYCAPVRSIVRQQDSMKRREVHPGVMRFTPKFLSDRANRLPGMRSFQTKWIARQILQQAAQMHLDRPVFLYLHLGGLLPVAKELKREGLFLVHTCIDYPEPLLYEHAEISDKTLVLQEIVFEMLRARFGTKISHITVAGNARERGEQAAANRVPDELERIPRPRLGYLGAPQQRLNKRLVKEIFERHPDWHFVFFGSEPFLPLPNVHAVPWQAQSDLPDFVAALDVGFMPYDCSNPLSFHCLPLKRFDHFAAGVPVVSTPILSFWQMRDVVYLGGTADELSDAIQKALAEKADDPRRARRKEYAREHSMAKLARRLKEELPLD